MRFSRRKRGSRHSDLTLVRWTGCPVRRRRMPSNAIRPPGKSRKRARWTGQYCNKCDSRAGRQAANGPSATTTARMVSTLHLQLAGMWRMLLPSEIRAVRTSRPAPTLKGAASDRPPRPKQHHPFPRNQATQKSCLSHALSNLWKGTALDGGRWIRSSRVTADGAQHAPNGIDPYVARRLDRQAVTFAQPSPALEIGQNIQGNKQLATLGFGQR